MNHLLLLLVLLIGVSSASFSFGDLVWHRQSIPPPPPPAPSTEQPPSHLKQQSTTIQTEDKKNIPTDIFASDRSTASPDDASDHTMPSVKRSVSADPSPPVASRFTGQPSPPSADVTVQPRSAFADGSPPVDGMTMAAADPSPPSPDVTVQHRSDSAYASTPIDGMTMPAADHSPPSADITLPPQPSTVVPPLRALRHAGTSMNPLPPSSGVFASQPSHPYLGISVPPTFEIAKDVDVITMSALNLDADTSTPAY